MNITVSRFVLALVLAFAAGTSTALLAPARAEQPALERALVERLVRAEEQQARQLEAIARAASRCGR